MRFEKRFFCRRRSIRYCFGNDGLHLAWYDTYLLSAVIRAVTVIVVQYRIINKGLVTNLRLQVANQSIVKTLALFCHYRFKPWWALSSTMINFFLVSFSSFIIPYVMVQVFLVNPIMIGLIEGCAAAGALVASFKVQRIVESLIGKTGIVVLSFVVVGSEFILFSLTDNIISWSLLTFILGMAVVLNNVSVEACRSIAIPEEHRVKIQSIHNGVIGLGNPFGLLLIPYIITHYSYSMALILSGLMVLIIFVYIRFIPLFYDLLGSDATDLYKRKYGDL